MLTLTNCSEPSVVIIGAGPGGLAAAISLASSGLSVKILERRDKVGGRTSAIESNGFRFDLGPTFFLYPRVLNEIFRRAGTRLENEVKITRLDPQYRLIFGNGGKLDATAEIERMEQQIAALAPHDAINFRSFLTENRLKLQRAQPCLENPFLDWRAIVNFRLLKLLPMLRPHQSLDQYLGRFFRDPRIRLAFSFQSKYLGMSPFRCPSLFSILSFLEYEHGVFHPEGGCAAVTEAVTRVAERLGVEIHLGSEVKEILFEGRRAVGVRDQSKVHAADALVINADFAQTISTLVPDRLRRRWRDQKIARKKFSCSTFMMYLGIEGVFDLPHHNIYISQNYARNLDEIENQHVLSEDPSFYVQNAVVTDRTLAPPGMSTLYVLVPVTHEHPNVDWRQHRDGFRSLVIQQIAKAGFSDVEKRVRFERVVTPLDWNREHRIYKGATFNLAHSLDQMLHLRPRNRFEDLEGVYLVGGGTHPGSGLPVIFESARISARLLLEDLGFSRDDKSVAEFDTLPVTMEPVR
ncbi:MAG: phytoene desaturase [Verrucomicrobia bacterium]|nr:phytoene desaturase [Verrucomicrobiota bacterium]